jgi:hypothetical protein
VRSACTVPHTVPAQYLRSGQVCPHRTSRKRIGTVCGAAQVSGRHTWASVLVSFPGPRTKSRWVCGSIPAEGPRRGKRTGRGCTEVLGRCGAANGAVAKPSPRVALTTS